MTFKAYVAGRTSDLESVRAVQQVVRDAGGRITFDWTRPKSEGGEGDIRSDWSMEAERARELSMQEQQAVFDADVVIAVYFNGTGLGKYLEIGMQMGLMMLHPWRKIVLLGDFRESVFWYLPGVNRLTAPTPELRHAQLAHWLKVNYGD